MLVLSKDIYKLVVSSAEMVDDNKKNEAGQWIPTGTKSEMCKYIFKNYTNNSTIVFSSKNNLYMTNEGSEGKIVLEVKQFGNKKPETKFVSFEISLGKK